jgi:polyhydroxybutyrate depolymerase
VRRLSVRRALLFALLILVVVSVCVAAAIFLLYGPTLACVRAATGPARPGTSGRIVHSGGRARCALLHVPPSANLSQPRPLVISLHGFQSKPELHRFLTGWDDLAGQYGFLVAYPQGSSFPLRWNANASANIPQVDDVQFLADLIATIGEVAAVDPARVYVSGFSNGGQMAHRVACELADKVAAVGIVAGWGAVLPENCEPSRPVPLIAFFGTADRQGDIGGGTSYVTPLMAWAFNLRRGEHTYPPLGEWIDGWVERNGCDQVPEPLPQRGDARGVAFAGCDEGADVVLYTIEGGGHTWPGGPSLPFNGKTSRDIDASATMWDFFSRFSLRQDP